MFGKHAPLTYIHSSLVALPFSSCHHAPRPSLPASPACPQHCEAVTTYRDSTFSACSIQQASR
ncbi:hypothetical protein DL93DRAFT_2090255 [Clavulina sp. PMI_390]|nr:hypothetical protein DL93DRAFT_2090255 [Clavulina sp. PMI_390]